MAATPRWRGEALLQRVKANVKVALDRSALIVQREIKLHIDKTGPGTRSGELRKSVQIDRSGINQFRIRVGPNIIYARIHEFGGTITAKAGTALLVPIGEKGRAYAKAHSGMRHRVSPWQMGPEKWVGMGGSGQLGKGQMGPERLVLIKRKGRAPLLARTIRGGKAIEPLFVLLKSVTIPKRPYVVPGLRAARPRVLAQFSAERLLR